jgi:molecular chaperone GrpE
MNEDQDDIVFEESTEEGMELGANAKVKKLQEKIKLLEKEKTEYLDGWQRARADYANLQKSIEEDKKRLRNIVEEDFIHELLPVVDSFLMAMKNKEAWEKVDANWRTGVEYIFGQLMGVLKDRGFENFGSEGETFDPSLHQAVSETETEDEALDHKISSVLQQGYKLGGSILRPARVSVYKTK